MHACRSTLEDPTPAGRAALLGEALQLWRGTPLQDAGSDRLRQRLCADLDELRLSALEDSVQARLELGRHDEVVAELAALTVEYPNRERLAELSMTALYAAGRSGDALAVYARTRETLAASTGLDPGPVLQRLQGKVLRAEPVPAVPRQRRAPCLLPAVAADLTGRQWPLDELEALLRNENGPRVVAVNGRPGTGKTTVAVAAAYRLADAYPDGQLFVDLHGAGPGPLAPGRVLARLLGALGVDAAAMPDGVDERAELYRDRLVGRRVLVVLDNAASAAQIRPLLPGWPGCAVVVTSRRALTAVPATHLRLEALPTGEAVELLGRIAGAARVDADPVAARAIVELCGHLPLAVRIAGGRLAARPQRPLAWLAGLLSDQRRRLDELALDDLEVRASLALSVEALAPAERRLLRLLALLDAPHVAAWTAAALLDVSADEAVRLLERLVDDRLVDPVEPGRYGLHDLVRLYARERAEAEDSDARRRAAVGRLAGAACGLLDPVVARLPMGYFDIHGPAPRYPVEVRLPADPVPWLDVEVAVLLDTVRLAAAYDLAGYAWDLAGSLHGYHLLRHQLDDLTAAHTTALAAARRTGDRLGEAVMLGGLGAVSLVQDRVGDAMAHYGQALTGFAALGDRRASATAQLGLAATLNIVGRLREADSLVTQALRTAHATGATRTEAIGLHVHGVIQLRLGRVERARRCFECALRIAGACGHRETEAHVLAWLGQLVGGGHAVAYLRAAVDVMAGIGTGTGAVLLAPRLAQAYAAVGDLPAALRTLDDCLARSREWGNRRAQMSAHRVRGLLHAGAGHRAEAVAELTRAVDIARKLAIPHDIRSCEQALRQVYASVEAVPAAVA